MRAAHSTKDAPRAPDESAERAPPGFLAYKWACSLAAAVVGMTVYNVIGRLDLPRSTTMLMTPIDEAIPFLVGTSWLYEPLYAAVFVVATIGFSSRRFYDRALVCIAANHVVAGVLHFVVRAEYPRPVLPSPAPDLSTAFLALVHRIDPASNVFPSLHVAHTFAVAFLLQRDRPRLGAATLAMAVVLSISTLTTKQHFLVDVVAGLAMALVGRALALRGLPPR